MQSHTKNRNDAPQRETIEHIRQKIRKVTGQDPVFGAAPDCPPEIEEEFLRNVLAFEAAPKRPLFDVLVDSGMALPRPETLNERQIQEKLWELIHALVERRVIISNTDHLSDRELYTALWSETLQQENVVDGRPETGYTLHIDMTGSRKYEDPLQVYLKYYAKEGERQMYAGMDPHLQIPAHCDPPYRRDQLLEDLNRGITGIPS